MKITIKYIFIVILAALAIYLSLDASAHSKENEDSLKNHRFLTVAKVVNYRTGKGGSIYEYVYYYNNVKYKNTERTIGNENACINKYYALELSTERPTLTRIHLDAEVTNPKIIEREGFNLKREYAREIMKGQRKVEY